MTVVVRRPNLADVDRLAAINLETWRDAYVGIVPAPHLDSLDLEVFRERWRRNLAEGRPGASFLVADVVGTLAGYAIVGSYRPQGGADPAEQAHTWGELYAIYTHPTLQGRGAGRALHDGALELLRNDGHDEAALWVLEANQRARAWYADRGWRADGATADWGSEGVALPPIRLRLALRDRAEWRRGAGECR
jgi:ribosomal protein S18 acetylase RimI-like enzyme